MSDRYIIRTTGQTGPGIEAHLADTTDAHDASAISYAGSANLSATTVEAALDELDTEKASVTEPVAAAHIADGTDAHPAAAIGVTDTAGNWTATDVEGVLAEVPSRYAPLTLLTADTRAALWPWYAALADRDSNPAKLMVVGDSITEARAVTALADRWQDRLNKMLRTRFPNVGVSTPTGVDRTYCPAFYVSTGFTGAQWAWTGSPSTASYGLGWRAYTFGTGVTGTFTFTGTAFTLSWTGGPTGGTFSYTVDGGSATNVSTTLGATTQCNLTAVTGLAAGSHTVVVQWVSGGNVNIEGAYCFNGDESKGIRVLDAGKSGMTAAYAASTGLTALSRSVTVAAPHLVYVNLGVNDYRADTSAATYLSNMSTILAAIRTAAPTAGIIASMWYQPVHASTPAVPWTTYVSTAKAAAAGVSNCAFLDWTDLFPAYTDASLSLLNADNIHPTAKGHAFIADHMLALLSPPAA